MPTIRGPLSSYTFRTEVVEIGRGRPADMIIQFDSILITGRCSTSWGGGGSVWGANNGASLPVRQTSTAENRCCRGPLKTAAIGGLHQ